MDLRQMLPLLLKGKLGEREQALLKLTENPDPAALGSIITQMYENQKNTPRTDLYATLKKIIPATTLGLIIKYFDAQKSQNSSR
ncbi:MAG: hypothetical protein J1G01_05540 [Clostridiales bacterium]|nr:hypothetical protein [Clostridiales bacterium]